MVRNVNLKPHLFIHTSTNWLAQRASLHPHTHPRAHESSATESSLCLQEFTLPFLLLSFVLGKQRGTAERLAERRGQETVEKK